MEKIVQLIHEHEHFVICGHTGPDGDAIGSCFGLAWALEKIGKKVQVVLEHIPSKYNVIPGKKFLHPGPIETLEANVFIALDCADKGRMGAAKKLFKRAKVTVCIDHHETNDGFADFNFVDPKASSTAEMVFKLIEKITEPNENIASAIYAGIISDTGGFRYNATAKSTMEIAARLMEMGIPFTQIYDELMYKHRFISGKVMGLALDNSDQALHGRIVYTYVTREMLATLGADPSDLEGVVEYLMGTRGADVSCLVYEKHTLPYTKVSLRSHGPNVGRVAGQLNGGGHQLAAGATVANQSVPDILMHVLGLLEEEIVRYDQQQ